MLGYDDDASLSLRQKMSGGHHHIFPTKTTSEEFSNIWTFGHAEPEVQDNALCYLGLNTTLCRIGVGRNFIYIINFIIAFSITNHSCVTSRTIRYRETAPQCHVSDRT